MALSGDTPRARKARLRIVTAPPIEPVTLAEAKTHLRVDGADEDTWILEAVAAATEAAQLYTRRQFLTATFEMQVDLVEGREWVLWRPPLASVQSVTGYNEDGTALVLAATDYYVDTASSPGRVVLKAGATWPVVTREYATYRCAYTAGYGSDPSSVPRLAKQGILAAVGWWYEHRETHADGQDAPAVARTLLRPLRVFY